MNNRGTIVGPGDPFSYDAEWVLSAEFNLGAVTYPEKYPLLMSCSFLLDFSMAVVSKTTIGTYRTINIIFSRIFSEGIIRIFNSSRIYY